MHALTHVRTRARSRHIFTCTSERALAACERELVGRRTSDVILTKGRNNIGVDLLKSRLFLVRVRSFVRPAFLVFRKPPARGSYAELSSSMWLRSPARGLIIDRTIATDNKRADCVHVFSIYLKNLRNGPRSTVSIRSFVAERSRSASVNKDVIWKLIEPKISLELPPDLVPPLFFEEGDFCRHFQPRRTAQPLRQVFVALKCPK